jgi:hypothetical protein
VRRSTVRTGTVTTIMLGLALTGCGTGRAGAPTPDEVARARQAGVDVALVYVTTAKGYTRTSGGMGPYGDSGFQDVYASGADDLRLTVEKRTLDAATCPRLPVPAAEPAGAPVRCTDDGDGWARTSGDRAEYAVQRGEHLVRVSGTGPADLLRDAALRARPATSAELDDMLPPASDGDPVRRGDLPDTGDGAPMNPTGPGG